MRRLTPALLIVTAVLSALLPAQLASAQGVGELVAVDAPAWTVWKGSGKDAPLRAGPNLVRPGADRPKTSTFTVTYTGFTAQQKAAFQVAVDAWSRIVVSTVPITIDARMEALEAGVLGAAGPGFVYRRDQGGTSSYVVPALANAQAGRDLNAQLPDMSASFSNAPSLYSFDATGRQVPGRYDFSTVVLHEITHGLGFLGNLDVVDGLGTYDDPRSTRPTPFGYDRLVGERSSQGTRAVLELPRGSTAMGRALQSGQLYWTGPSGRNGAGGAEPRLYGPSRWE